MMARMCPRDLGGSLHNSSRVLLLAGCVLHSCGVAACAGAGC
jgi:hypothetical protein